MIVAVECPKCEQKFKIKTFFRIRKTTCPKCQEEISLKGLKALKKQNKTINEMESERSFMMGSFR